MKPVVESAGRKRAHPKDGGPKALFRLPDKLQEINDAFHANRPKPQDPPEVLGKKIEAQEKAQKDLLEMTVSLIEQRGSISQPALVTRKLTPLFDLPRFEVRSLDRADAEPGRPIFVTADPAFAEEIKIGDVVVVSGDGSRIIDMDNDLARSGEYAAVIGVHKDHGLPFELELEGETQLFRRIEAMAWERLNPLPSVGDRVRVMGGVIHGYAPTESVSRFKVNSRKDLDRRDLHGPVPRRTLDLILSKVHRHFHADLYPPRSRRFSDRDALLLYGGPGVGKTWTVTVAWSMIDKAYNNGKEQVAFFRTEGAAVEGSLVGSGPKTLREIRSCAKKAASEGKLPITFINEAGSLLRNREIQGMQLDGGSSIATHEQFLAMLSGPDEIPGLLLVDLNTEKSLDEATRQRFTCVAYPHIDRAVLVDQMFKGAFQKERDLFEGDWQEMRGGLMGALDATIGSVLVGSDSVPVKVGHLSSGRLYEKVIQECLSLVDLCVYNGHEGGVEPLFTRITTPLLYYAITHRAWSLFKCWDTSQARERLVPEVVRPEKTNSLSNPTPIPWDRVEMPSQYDCREVLDGLMIPMEEIQ